ncbi:hypothetical protein DRN52_08680 [Thermococci archaeon]|nr:MAG: hypothetical protein DRN52_08680 [Thermococci archaeon]
MKEILQLMYGEGKYYVLLNAATLPNTAYLFALTVLTQICLRQISHIPGTLSEMPRPFHKKSQ